MPLCQSCNYDSPSGAKFCRQCGAPLIAETELSGAATRNYGRQEAAPNAASAPLPPSVADALAEDTKRHYQSPAGFAPVTSLNTAPLQPWVASKRFLSLFLLVVICCALAGLFLVRQASPRRRAPVPELAQLQELAQLAEQERLLALQHANENQLQDRIREAQDRAREAQDRLREMQQRQRELAQRALEQGGVPVPGAGQPLDLSSYEYPGATANNYSRIPGNELLVMRVGGAFETIQQYYEKKLGKPLLYNKEGDWKSAIFQSPGAPQVFVTIEPAEGQPYQWVITVTRALAVPRA